MQQHKLKKKGYTLIELIVAMGLFSIIMLLASGAYLVVISLNRQAQGMAAGIDNLAFAIEIMARSIRTGTSYSCAGAGNCADGASNLSFVTAEGTTSYELDEFAIQQEKQIDGNPPLTLPLTDPLSVKIDELTFYVSGVEPYSPSNDVQQPYVRIIISGSVFAGVGKPEQLFTIETGAAMRGTDL